MNIKTNIFPYKNLHLLWHISCQIQLKDLFVEGFKCRRVNRDTWNSQWLLGLSLMTSSQNRKCLTTSLPFSSIWVSSTPSLPFKTKLFMDDPSGYKTKSSNRVWTLLAVVFVVLSDSFVSSQAITHTQKGHVAIFRDFFFYVGMRTFSMVLLPVNLDHGGIGTFKGLGFRDLLLGPVNFRDPSSLCLREFLKFLIGKY